MSAAREYFTDAEADLNEQRSSGSKEVDPLAPMKRQGALLQDKAAGTLVAAYAKATPAQRGFTLVGPVYKHVVISDPRWVRGGRLPQSYLPSRGV